MLPTGLVINPATVSGPAGWTFDVTPTGLDGQHDRPVGTRGVGVITFGAVVGELPRSASATVTGDLRNEVCVDSTEPDMNPEDNCNFDVVPTRSIALSGDSVCRNDTPFVSYSIIPNNILSVPPPAVALIWWTAEAYAGRDPSIDASDEAALLADGALRRLRDGSGRLVDAARRSPVRCSGRALPSTRRATPPTGRAGARTRTASGSSIRATRSTR